MNQDIFEQPRSQDRGPENEVDRIDDLLAWTYIIAPSPFSFQKTVFHTKHACLNKSPTSTYKPHTAHSIQPTIAPSDSSSVHIPDENPGLSLGSKLLIAYVLFNNSFYNGPISNMEIHLITQVQFVVVVFFSEF